MTAPGLERALAETLHRHAEDAMNKTDTRHEYERLEDRIDEEVPRRRRRLASGVLVAAAAAVAAGLWTVNLDGDAPRTEPTLPSTPQTPEERVAQGFFAAFAAGDAAGAASYVDRGEVAWRDWLVEMRTDAAWSRKYFVHPCEELSTSAAGVNVTCAFEYHVFRSEDLGLGPFDTNVLTVRVSDGKVVSGDLVMSYQSNGQGDLFDEIGAWVRQNHPGDWRFLAGTEGHSRAELDRWYSLWDQRLDEYVADRLG